MAMLDPDGSHLIEVFSVVVVIDGMDDVTSADIDGVFRVTDVDGKFIDCYKRVQGSPSVLPNGTLSLSGPFRCLAGPDFGFEIRLRETTKNLEICNGEYSMGQLSYTGLNTPINAVVPGDNGYAIVNFMLLEEASQATIEVTLDACCGDDEPEIYGSIWATHDVCRYDNFFDDKYCMVSLFYVSKDNAVKPRYGNKIPLSRTTVAVPLGTRIYIDADLFQGSSELGTQSQSAYFTAQVSGEAIESIGPITVKVSWNPDPFKAAGLKHPYGTYADYY